MRWPPAEDSDRPFRVHLTRRALGPYIRHRTHTHTHAMEGNTESESWVAQPLLSKWGFVDSWKGPFGDTKNIAAYNCWLRSLPPWTKPYPTRKLVGSWREGWRLHQGRVNRRPGCARGRAAPAAIAASLKRVAALDSTVVSIGCRVALDLYRRLAVVAVGLSTSSCT